ncbi:MAG: SPOR domain-containing protein [Saprospiraceae bacterium]|nr:SPOR domain-containing protein [Saprospiraceae bacterium]
MGPNSLKNWTYAALALVMGALGYLIYNSSKAKTRLNPNLDNTSGLSGYDSLGALSTTSPSAIASDSLRTTIDGELVSPGSTPSSYSNRDGSARNNANTAISATSDMQEVPMDEVDNLSSSSIGPDESIASSEKSKVATKSIDKSKPAKPKAKFDAGNGTGEFMVVAGSFASKDNAAGLVEKMKKMGFTKAEAVKMENSANVYAVAGQYSFKGGADAAVRTLKAKGVPALVKKRDGEIYRPTPTAAQKPKALPKPVSTNTNCPC